MEIIEKLLLDQKKINKKKQNIDYIKFFRSFVNINILKK